MTPTPSELPKINKVPQTLGNASRQAAGPSNQEIVLFGPNASKESKDLTGLTIERTTTPIAPQPSTQIEAAQKVAPEGTATSSYESRMATGITEFLKLPMEQRMKVMDDIFNVAVKEGLADPNNPAGAVGMIADSAALAHSDNSNGFFKFTS